MTMPNAHRDILETANELGYFPLKSHLRSLSNRSGELGIAAGLFKPGAGPIPDDVFRKCVELACVERYEKRLVPKKSMSMSMREVWKAIESIPTEVCVLYKPNGDIVKPKDSYEHQEQKLRLEGIPDALIKATMDPFEYALKLITGELIFFGEATISEDFEWVHLSEIKHVSPSQGEQHENGVANFDRGLDVRVSQIVWVADAPHGS